MVRTSGVFQKRSIDLTSEHWACPKVPKLASPYFSDFTGHLDVGKMKPCVLFFAASMRRLFLL